MPVPYVSPAADPAGIPARPEPVLDAARVGGLVSALAVAVGGVVVVAGLATVEDVSRWTVAVSGVVAAVIALVSYAAPVIQARRARELVTPLADPRTAAGVALVEDERRP